MFNFIKKWKENKDKVKKYNILYEKNYNFLDKISEYESINYFNYFKGNTNIKIIYSKKKYKNKSLNDFYNIFFSEYESISIGELEQVKISSSYLDSYENNYLENIVSIGKDLSDMLYIKKNGDKNNVFIETIDLEDSIIENESMHQNIYYYMLFCIGNILEIDLEMEYNKYKCI